MHTYQLWIDGAFVNPASGQWLDTVDPYQGKPWAKIPRGNAEDGARAVAAAEEVHVEQHHVLRLYGDTGSRFRLLQVGDGDVGLERFVREVETDGVEEVVFKRHLVDRLGARPRVEMEGSIDMGAGVVAHGERHGGG